MWKSENSITWVLLKFSVPVAIFSAFLANIPLVAMMIPPIVEYSKKVQFIGIVICFCILEDQNLANDFILSIVACTLHTFLCSLFVG